MERKVIYYLREQAGIVTGFYSLTVYTLKLRVLLKYGGYMYHQYFCFFENQM